MSQVSAAINEEVYGSDICNFDDLKQAVERLTTASESQFESIKKEKWYNRVWDMVTLSKNKKDKIRLSGQIGSLAQAQQILMDILVRLSSHDEKVAGLVQANMENIQKLADNQVFVIDKLKELKDSYLLGIRRTMEVADLSDEDKAVLKACLSYLSDYYNPTGDQQDYARTLLGYIGNPNIEVAKEKIGDNLSCMTEDKRKIVLYCCMEYAYLNRGNMELPDEAEEFFDEFDLGNKTYRKFKDQISEMARLVGMRGLIDKYKVENVDDEFLIDFLDDEIWDDPQEETEEETPEITDEIISSILHVKKNEGKIIAYKNIRLKSFIQCEGTLCFDHCIITYNEPDTMGSKITLEKDAKLVIKDCQIFCEGYNKEGSFIESPYGGNTKQITIEDSLFTDCSRFIEVSDLQKLIIRNCYIKNCNEFVKAYFRSDVHEAGEISHNRIIMDGDYKKFNKEARGFLFGLASPVFVLDPPTLVISENLIEELDSYHTFLREYYGDRMDWNREQCFGGDVCASIDHCTFINIRKYTISAKTICNCRFKRGKSSVSAMRVEECIFDSCSITIYPDGDSPVVSHCQFVNCYGNLVYIDNIYHKGLSMKYCEFKNIFPDNESRRKWSVIEFSGRKDREKLSTNISNCTFENIHLDDTFIIDVDGHEESNINAYVKDCMFVNCSTDHKSGKLINDTYRYYGLFNKIKTCTPLRISNCSGLEHVKKGEFSSAAGRAEAKSENSKGEPIGVSAKDIAAKAAVYVLAGTVGPAGVLGLEAGKAIMNRINEKDQPSASPKASDVPTHSESNERKQGEKNAEDVVSKAEMADRLRVLKERTDAGFLDCREALEKAGGDMEAAVKYLKKEGTAFADE